MRHWILGLFVFAAAGLVIAATIVPTEIEQPGTQPGEGNGFSDSCNCHDVPANPQLAPVEGWRGSMMSQAMRDGLFWATVAIAEQDFLPGADPAARGGAGDLCLRCHGPRGWLDGHSTPTDGSAFTTGDTEGVECEFCHLQVNPDQPLNIPGTVEQQNGLYTAYDATTGEGHYGGGQYVINTEGSRLGPYSDPFGNHHTKKASSFHREGELCGTCHDVSNPAVGDLAHNNGAQTPLDPDSFSGVLGGSVADKAAFNNKPYAFGVVERTFSEWKASGLDDFEVNDFPTLPADLTVTGGSLDVAYHRAYDAASDADHADGTVRYFTCQTCHMSASTGYGCDKGGTPLRRDLGRHDLTGGGYWMPDVILHQEDNGTLLFGSGLSQDRRDALAVGKTRAGDLLRSAASLAATQDGAQVVVQVTNLTGHKLISGYPEGRRMWLNVEWRDGAGDLVREDGAYGQIGRTAEDLNLVVHQVESLVDPDSTHVWHVVGGIDQEWAQQLVDLGYDPALPMSYDRINDNVEHTLGELAAAGAGTAFHTFRFVLNNVVMEDNRIPPYGFAYDDALERNILPVPSSQFGDPGAGGIYDHFDDVQLAAPSGATTATIRLYYQQTSWEYVHFLVTDNDGLSPFLGNEGVNLLDAWLNTGQSAPFEITSTTLDLIALDELIFADGFETGGSSAWSLTVP